MRVLAGDVGGTNARLAIIDIDGETIDMVCSRVFPSREYPGLGPIVQTFLEQFGEKPINAVFGVACPVTGNICAPANLPWTIDVNALRAELGMDRLQIINDLHAAGYGLQMLKPNDLVPLQTGMPDKSGAIAVIAAGTGLGEAFLTKCADGYVVHNSEGGHADFTPRNDEEYGLFGHLASKFGHVSQERVVSGPGLVNIYRYLVEIDRTGRQDVLNPEQLDAVDSARTIAQRAETGADPIGSHALDIFVSAYGAQAGNLALTVGATGGIYIAGGIARSILPKMASAMFIASFRGKGRLSDLMSRFPVSVIINPDVGLIGAAKAASMTR